MYINKRNTQKCIHKYLNTCNSFFLLILRANKKKKTPKEIKTGNSAKVSEQYLTKNSKPRRSGGKQQVKYIERQGKKGKDIMTIMDRSRSLSPSLFRSDKTCFN